MSLAARSAPVSIPSRAIFSAPRGPMPWKRRIGNPATYAVPSPGRITHSPSGLFSSLASLARNLLYETPALAVSPVCGADLGADDLGDTRRRPDPAQVVGDVEIGLVERERFDVRGEAEEDRADLPRDLLVDIEARLAEHQSRAQPRRPHRRHRRAYPERARLVARGRDHPALGRAADRDRLAAQRWVVALLDAGVERVHVDMDDLAQPGRRLVVLVAGPAAHAGDYSAIPSRRTP